MQITEKWMAEWFEIFNRDYFGGSLPMPRLALSKSKTRLGTMTCKCKNVFGRKRFSDFSISVSNFYDIEENEFKNVLLHEMIHYYISYNGIKDTSSHGEAFRRIMNTLNSEHGWNIRISTSARQWRAAEPQKQCIRLVLALKMKSGEHILTVVNRNYARLIDNRLSRIKDVSERKWYLSDNDFFADFKTVRSLRGRRVNKDIYERMTQEMIRYDLISIERGFDLSDIKR